MQVLLSFSVLLSGTVAGDLRHSCDAYLCATWHCHSHLTLQALLEYPGLAALGSGSEDAVELAEQVDGMQWDPARATELTVTDETPGHLAGNFNTLDGELDRTQLELYFAKPCDV